MKDLLRLLRVYIIRSFALIRAKKLELSNRILIVAPHPDDEVIGCSGLIQQAIIEEKEIFVCILTGGEGSHRNCCNIKAQDLIDNRRKLAKSIDGELGIPDNHLFFLNFPDGDIVSKVNDYLELERVISEIQPDSIYIPHQKGEGWSDHIQAGNIVKSIIANSPIALYEYCVWFWYYNVWNLNWRQSFLLKMNKLSSLKKTNSIDNYTRPLAPCGKPYSGVLPKLFIKANKWNNELYFKLK